MSLRTARGRAEESSRCELEAVRLADPSIHFVSTRRLLASVPHGIVHEDGAPAIYFLGLPTYNQVLGPKNQDSFFFCEAKHRRGRFWHLENGALHNNRTYTCCKCRNEGLQNNCLGRCLAHLQRQQKRCRGFFAFTGSLVPLLDW